MRGIIVTLVWLTCLLNADNVGSAISGNPLLDSLPADGWTTWRVEAVPDMPLACCFGTAQEITTCQLDGSNHYRGFRSTKSAPTTHINIYLRTQEGQVKDVRSLAADCPVAASSDISNLGTMSNANSVTRLSDLLDSTQQLASGAISAIAGHAGSAARHALLQAAQVRQPDSLRKDAIFWMGQLRSHDLSAELLEFMFSGSSRQIREHAVFSVAQSKIPQRGAALIRLGQQDRDPKIRAKAWFWLAQSDTQGARQAILEAVYQDSSRQVQKEAIFALSQLPPPQAVASLVQLAEDRTVTTSNRKQALFWLGHDASDQAVEYFDKLFTSP